VPALTEFVPLAHKDRWTLVEALPQTGRMHQIRRHARHLNHPIVGDVNYGKGDINRLFREQYGLHRLALHSWRMRVPQANGNILELEAAIPDDLRLPLEKLGIDLSVLS
jgi:tRNA pseudouridine65 synthase